jgi:hypothetical protein
MKNAFYVARQTVFSVAVEKLRNYNIQDYDFAYGSVWV